MNDSRREWENLCEQAAAEQDPECLMRLVRRIAELLDDRQPSARANDRIQLAGSSSSD